MNPGADFFRRNQPFFSRFFQKLKWPISAGFSPIRSCRQPGARVFIMADFCGFRGIKKSEKNKKGWLKSAIL
jgi:hypothetical protein